MNNELNSRQWALYNYLKEQGDEWNVQIDVVYNLNDYYECEFPCPAFHDSPARHLLTKDIQTINKSNVIQKIILSSPKGIKLASESDFEVYIRSQYAALWRRKERLDKIAKKGSRDGQMRIVFNSERDTVKAFIDSDKAIGERLKLSRLRANYSQAQVVAAMHEYDTTFDAPLLSRFENGYCIPNKRTLANIAEIYAVTPEFILTGILPQDAENGENKGLQAVKRW